MMGAAIAVRSATGTAPVAVVQRHTVQYARRMPRLIRPSAGFTPSAAAPAKPPIRPGRSPRPAAERSHNLRTAKWAPPVAETFQPLPALQRTSRKVLYWSAHRSPVQQQPGEPVAPISFVRRPRPWPARSRGSRAPVASVVVPPATTVPATLRGRSWRPILRIRSIQRAGPGATIIPAVPAPIGFIQRHLPWRRKLHISPQFIPGQIAAVIAPGVPQSAQPRRPRLAHKPQPATALRAQFPAPTVPILRGKAWRRRPVQVQFAPQKAVPPPAFVPQTWWRRIWLPFRKHPKPTSFAPGVPTGTPLPNTINCSTFVIRTLACEPTIARLLTGEAVVTNTLKCEARRV
jgi:hypothetical protein